jgi:uncharacterized membrane protein YsdA (DUF1294 family)
MNIMMPAQLSLYPLPLPVAISLAWVVAASLVTLVAYALDKQAAIRAGRRTPERTLHTLALLGGWPGGLIAMHLFKHKRRKAAFVRVFWLTAVVHVVVVGLLLRLLR